MRGGIEALQCACGNILGQLVAGDCVVRHRGREWVGQARSIKCEDCGRVNYPPKPEQANEAMAVPV